MMSQIAGMNPLQGQIGQVNVEQFLNSVYGKSAGIDKGGAAPKTDFKDMLLSALDYVNERQQTSAALAQQFITDPDSLDVHDVTTAVQEAAMSLELAQNVISRMVSAWNEITTTR
jgi:flagellar hook-basal body complex protein FliE